MPRPCKHARASRARRRLAGCICRLYILAAASVSRVRRRLAGVGRASAAGPGGPGLAGMGARASVVRVTGRDSDRR